MYCNFLSKKLDFNS